MFQLIRRALIKRKHFPDSWLQTLKTRAPYYSVLPEPLRSELHKRILVLMAEKNFEGCGGFKLSESEQVIIAAYAGLLIIGEPSDYYPSLRTILVYPENYMAPVHEEDDSGIMTEGIEPRSGESWDLGTIVLSWDDIQIDLEHPFSGQNLIIHEFSHQLDNQYGMTAGIGINGNIYTENEWNKTLSKHYLELRRDISRGRKNLLDPYGSTNPAEFFAVATECFFENGYRLQLNFPKLYAMLKNFYNIDPASFLDLHT
jgi:MtfA peptidase